MPFKINLRDHAGEMSNHLCEMIIYYKKGFSLRVFPPLQKHILNKTLLTFYWVLCYVPPDSCSSHFTYVILLQIYQNPLKKFCCLHFPHHAERLNISNQDTASGGGRQTCNAALLTVVLVGSPHTMQSEQRGGFEWQCLQFYIHMNYIHRWNGHVYFHFIDRRSLFKFKSFGGDCNLHVGWIRNSKTS